MRKAAVHNLFFTPWPPQPGLKAYMGHISHRDQRVGWSGQVPANPSLFFLPYPPSSPSPPFLFPKSS